MNENPGETPNPLNPTPGVDSGANNPPLNANPAEPVGTPTNEVPVDEAQQVDPLMQATAGITDQNGSDPLSRPMEQAPVAEPVAPPKKKKTGLIIGIAVALVLLIGGGVAAALLLRNQGDPVTRAVAKIMEGKTPTNVAINGTIEVQSTDTTSSITNVKVDLNSSAMTNSLINATSADVTITVKNLGDINFKAEEIYAESGDLYLKVDGVKDAVNNIITMMNDTTVYEDDDLATNCIDDESGMTNCADVIDEVDCLDEEDCAGTVSPSTYSELTPYLSIAETIDGVWFRISVDEIKQLTSSSTDSESTKCVTDFLGEVKNNSNSIAEAYRKNPFIISTTEGVTLASKNSTVYKVTFDEKNLNGFSNTIQNSDWVKKGLSCLGEKTATEENIAEEISETPTFYVEVDKDNNFSRIYFSDEIGGSVDCSCPEGAVCSTCPADETLATVTLDLGLTYPDNINVAAPSDYQDLSSFIQQLFTTNY